MKKFSVEITEDILTLQWIVDVCMEAVLQPTALRRVRRPM